MNRHGKNVKAFFAGLLTTFTIAVAGKVVINYGFPSPESALPWEATDIRIERYVNGFLPDYTYSMRAAISERDFLEFVRRIGLSAHYDPVRETYREEDRRRHWQREAYYRDGYLHYTESQV